MEKLIKEGLKLLVPFFNRPRARPRAQQSQDLGK